MQSPISFEEDSMQKLKKSIVNRWIANGVIDEEDRELYEYGIEITIEHLINVITCTVLAIITGEILAYVVLILSFMKLRNYAGGIHASSFVKCYVCSTLVILAALLFIKYKLISILIYRMVASISTIYLFVCQHGETENRVVSEMERKVYSRKKRIILICLIILIGVVAIFNLVEIEKGIESAIIISGVSVWMNYLDYYIIEK